MKPTDPNFVILALLILGLMAWACWRQLHAIATLIRGAQPGQIEWGWVIFVAIWALLGFLLSPGPMPSHLPSGKVVQSVN